ncbi:hypothetical protein GDO78_010133 [Eleutherodactylus coqui]|uniref:ISXO2-like transposase domain-containing protein n=1 Tax=Eleutherodactylus coqui TaxID=57060 RepID=A0A8J6FBP2_ELECQ|nr:hypothetical protein GDO78_010133 [Eleutherodactylus coqui]
MLHQTLTRASDPSMHEFCFFTSSEDVATDYAKQVGLLLNIQQVLDQQHPDKGQTGKCLLGTVGCPGIVLPARKTASKRGKIYEGFRCSRCKRFRSVKNAVVEGEIRGGHQAGDKISFFATIAADSRSHTKISIKHGLCVMYLWAKDLSVMQMKKMMCGLVTQQRTFMDWRNYLREVCQRSLNEAAPMGGPGRIVQIDESLIRARQKPNKGRVLPDNPAPLAQQNYGNCVVGPWVFGMVLKRPDGTQEMRMFHVLRRNERTLRAIIQRHIAPGTEIWTDEWAAYQNIQKWRRFEYIHKTVNHQPPNTQRIESTWGHVKSHILRHMQGKRIKMLPGYLAEYWWKKEHQKTPFNDIIAEITAQFPLL